jgi:hypothetical protein
MKQNTRRRCLRHCLILFTGSLLLALAPAVFAQKTPGGSSGGAEVSLLNVDTYSGYFTVKIAGKNYMDDKYTDKTSDDDYNRMSAVSGDTATVDTPLEIALLSYYSKPVLKIRPPEAQKELPANSKDSALKLGAATYMEMQVNKYLGSAKGAGDNSARYATMLKFIEKKSGVTQAEIVNYMKEGIIAEFDRGFALAPKPADIEKTEKEITANFFLNPCDATHKARNDFIGNRGTEGSIFAGVLSGFSIDLESSLPG